MSITAEALRELHRLHRQATDLRDRLTRGPKQVKAREGNVAHLTNEFEAAKEALTKVKMSVKEKELSLKSREDRILDLQAKKNSCSSNREYQTLLEQIAADEQANSVLSDS
jgi:predicted  nucleic acid-binding Zn-ribbon protein